MRTIKLTSAILILFFVLRGVSFCDEGKPPKIGFVRNDAANVRAGDNINFKSLCRLEKGDPVRIVGKRYSWFKIVLPKRACLYIKSDYVGLVRKKGLGIVNAKRVNFRAGPGTKYAILGQVSKPDKLHVLGERDGWYRIVPPKGTTGWIHSSQITFSMEMPGETKKKKTAETKKEVLKPRLTPEPPKSRGNLTFSAGGSK